jgi:outer membrane protein
MAHGSADAARPKRRLGDLSLTELSEVIRNIGFGVGAVLAAVGAVSAYLDVRSAVEQVDLLSNSVRVIGQEQQAATDRFEVGEITQTDVAQADAALASARASLSSAEGDLEIAREAYHTATGQAVGAAAAAQAAGESGRGAGYRATHPSLDRSGTASGHRL